jgi:L-asparaginase II
VEAIRVTVRRGSVVEAVHRVHCVAVQDGEVVAQVGDSGLVCFYRSSAKPIQALQLVRAGPKVPDEELAIACASHRAEPAQLQAARLLLERARAVEGDLECGLQEGRVPEPLFHNCSGKHAGMLAVCRARGWPTEGYRLPAHALQRAILADVADAADVRADEIETAVDGCGVVTFALPLERMAFSFSGLEDLGGGARVAAAMRAHPELVGGVGALDTDLMTGGGGWLAKGGAEGLLCALGPGRVGIALKCEDGSFNHLRPALGRFLELLDRPVDGIGPEPLLNSRGEIVGEIAASE